MKLSLIIEAINRASRPIDGVVKSVGGLTRKTREAGSGLTRMGRDMTRAERSASRLEQAGYRVGHGIGSGVRKSVTALSALDRKIQFTDARMHKLAFGAGRMIGSTVRYGALAAGTAAAGGLLAAAYKIVTSGLQFERYRTQLTGLEGSADAGNRAMAWVTDFARATPYELGDVMEAFIALKSYGIDPTDGSLRTLGDTAAGMGKGLMQAIEMMADAQTGEFERLKEFGVRASVAGEKVTFTYMRNGRELTKTVRKNAAEINRTLSTIFNERFAGGMDRMAKTTEGKWSNMMDRMTTSANRVWEGGLGSAINEQLDRLSSWIDEMDKDGSLKKWAEDTGQGLGNFIRDMANQDWKGVGADIRTVASAIRTLGEAVQVARSWGRWIDQKATEASGLLGSYNLGTGQYRAAPWANSAADWLTGNGRSLRRPADPRSNGVPLGPMPMRTPRALPGNGRGTARPAAPGNAKISLHVTSDRGTTVAPTKIAAKGVDLDVNTGRAMRSVA